MSAQAKILHDWRHDAASEVTATLNFTEPTADKGYAYAYPPPEGLAQTNIRTLARQVTIANARPAADDLSLDREGVAVLRRRTSVGDFWDEAQTLALGHPEAAQLVFDHTLRRRQDGVEDRTSNLPRQPAARAHVDQTVRSGPERVRSIMGAEADALLKRRAAIINVWRPIAHVARDWPLAFADASSVAPGDLVASDLIFPHRRGEIYGVAYNPAQRWLYIPDLGPDEAILIKCWDSDASVAQFAPHTGFEDPTTPSGAPPRQSIEFRTIAFFD
jgi:hypothetical protein